MIVTFAVLACTSSTSDITDDEIQTDDSSEILVPVATTLVFPEKNSQCWQGQNIDTQKSTITFQWNQSTAADFYTIIVRELSTQITYLNETESTSIDIELPNSSAYEWFVYSNVRNSAVQAQSPIWKFYNAGVGTENRVPSSATLLFPRNKAIRYPNTGNNLLWSSEDEDGDILGYKVFFGESSDELNLIYDGFEPMTRIPTDIDTSKFYYWQVETYDANGNRSLSIVGEFYLL
jgi:hypothetical protein